MIVGVVAAPYFAWCWGQVIASGIIFDPLFAAGLRGYMFNATILCADFFASVIMLLPVALALRTFGKPRMALHTGLAALSLFIAGSSIVGWPVWPSRWVDLIANLSPYIALYASVRICGLIRWAPNNSFKPKPLRGSA